jgi:hypothetical protein
MPVILPKDKLDAWLSGEAGKEILVPYPANEMTVWPISPRVNSPKFQTGHQPSFWMSEEACSTGLTSLAADQSTYLGLGKMP